MLIEVKVPMLAESVAEATLMDWHKKPGETVKKGDSLIDIETDKVTLEIAAIADGVISEVIKESGEVVASDEVIARIDTSQSITDDDATLATTQSAPSDAESDGPERMAMEDEAPRTSPAVRNMAAEAQLDLTTVPTQTIPGRVTKEDVVDHLEQHARTREAGLPPSSPPSPSGEDKTKTEQTDRDEAISVSEIAEIKVEEAVPVRSETQDVAAERLEERVPMTRLRKRAAERLLSAQQENAILTTFNEVDMQAVMALRKRYKDEFAKQHEVKLGFMSFFTKAAVEALKKFPVINASVDGENILYHNYFDIGIAVSAPRGLVVPVVRDADRLSLAGIEKQIRALSERARDNKLSMDDLTGGTFTITNGGVFGSLLSTPILNPPQSAILGMHKIQQRPVVEQDQILVRPMMYLALSYDHRIIDGSEAVQFLVAIKAQLEDPSRMFLQL